MNIQNFDLQQFSVSTILHENSDDIIHTTPEEASILEQMDRLPAIRTAKHLNTEPERVQEARLVVKEPRGGKARSEAWDRVRRVEIEEAAKKAPEVNVSLNIGYSDKLVKAKCRMEKALMNDYCAKSKCSTEKTENNTKANTPLLYDLVFTTTKWKFKKQ